MGCKHRSNSVRGNVQSWASIHEVCLFQRLSEKMCMRFAFSEGCLGCFEPSEHGSTSDCTICLAILFHLCRLIVACLRDDHLMTTREFMGIYKKAENPQTNTIFTFQVREKVKMIFLKPTYSSNMKWKENFFFASGDWEFSPTKAIHASSVPWETNIPTTEGTTLKTNFFSSHSFFILYIIYDISCASFSIQTSRAVQ
jgi:hypothetical protein